MKLAYADCLRIASSASTSVVPSASSIPCDWSRWRPSIIRTLETPSSSAARHAVSFAIMAHQDLQQVVTEPDLQRLSADLGVTYADLVRHGQWDTRTREAIDALVANVQRQVTGAVRLKLYKGDCRVAGRRAAGEVRSTKLEVRSRKATEATSR